MIYIDMRSNSGLCARFWWVSFVIKPSFLELTHNHTMRNVPCIIIRGGPSLGTTYTKGANANTNLFKGDRIYGGSYNELEVRSGTG